MKEKLKRVKKSLSLIYSITPVMLFLSALCILATSLYSPIDLIIQKKIFDFVGNTLKIGWSDKANKELLIIIGMYLLLNLGDFILSKLNSLFTTFSGVKISRKLQNLLLKFLKGMEFTRYEDVKFYNELQLASKEATGDNFIQLNSNLVNLLCQGVVFIIYGIMISKFSILAFIICIGCCIPGFLHQAWFGKKNWKFVTSQVQHVRKMDYIYNLLTSKEAYKDNKTFNVTSYHVKKHKDLFCKYYKNLKIFNKENCIKGVFLALIHALGTVSVIGWAYFSAMKGQITLGEAVLYVGIAQSLYNSVQQVIYYYGNITSSENMCNNWFIFIEHNCKLESEDFKEEIFNGEIDSIKFENVSFSYPNSNTEVLKGVSFEINKGQKVALVGENGSGKSTIVKLLLGLYSPKSGKIYINNKDISSINKDDLKEKMAACFQDFYIYSYVVKENIGFGNIKNIESEELVKEAAVKSGFYDVLKSKDANLGNYINKDFSKEGLVLSGGQAQKLALSRAFFKGGDVIILDEPSSALDIKAESEIFEKTLTLIENKIVFFITHRLSNVVNSDVVLFLKDGKIAERGTHKELLNLNGGYAELFNLQAKRYKKNDINSSQVI